MPYDAAPKFDVLRDALPPSGIVMSQSGEGWTIRFGLLQSAEKAASHETHHETEPSSAIRACRVGTRVLSGNERRGPGTGRHAGRRNARAALATVEQAYGSSPSTSARLKRLALADVNYELRAGDRAEPEPLVATAGQLRKGAKNEFREPAFQQLAASLEARAAELAAVAPEQWSAACLAQAQKYAPLSPQDVQAERRELLKRLDALERRLPSLNDPERHLAKILVVDGDPFAGLHRRTGS